MSETMWEQKLRNWLHTAVLLIGMGGLLAALGYMFAGPVGLMWMGGLSVAVLAFGPRFSAGSMLRRSGARELAGWEAPRLQDEMRTLAKRAELSFLPKLFVLPSRSLVAFSTGTGRDACVAVSTGLLNALDWREIRGVLAHETSHIRNHDTWILGLTDMMRRMTSSVSHLAMFLLLLNLPLMLFGAVTVPLRVVLLMMAAPTVSALMQLALSRTREFEADLEAARLAGEPYGLASALEKLEYGQLSFWERLLGVRRTDLIPEALRTHPSTDERVARLLALAGGSHGADRQHGSSAFRPFSIHIA